MTNEERIKADAEAYVAKTRGQQGRVETYIAGATAEHDRAKVLVDALEAIMNTGWQNYQAHEISKIALEQWKSGKGKEVDLYKCPCCQGDGKETCTNPDHGFIKAVGGETQRLGCPVCGHDPNHKVNNGGKCNTCDGTGYDNEPEQFNNPQQSK